MCPSLKIKVFTGDHNAVDMDNHHNDLTDQRHGTVNAKFFKDSDNFDNFDVVIHNAAITSGLDVSGRGFDYVNGYIKTGQMSP